MCRHAGSRLDALNTAAIDSDIPCNDGLKKEGVAARSNSDPSNTPYVYFANTLHITQRNRGPVHLVAWLLGVLHARQTPHWIFESLVITTTAPIPNRRCHHGCTDVTS
ncbi:hypothetical protein R69749_07136 [Paraburkholderia domus]|jgi:hypothetical protein|nr:hypothetical protein R70006_04861 [Paraburkholderia domus]CAE6795271.1 hypothetical protein R75483_05083 [Paraburkholderia domus]CAE6882724.1 hypothetical protein R69749_07136 [Paraburkholderia domus]